MMTTYTILVYTGTADYAGTDADVYITLYGDKGTSTEFELDNSENNFEKGKKDKFTLGGLPDYGNLNQVHIRHNNSGSNPGWFLEKIEITNESTKRTWTFPCHNWLATDEKDGKIDRTLHAS